MCCRKYPSRCSSDTPTTGAPRSAADRSVSPERMPSPPLYVGIACSRQISMEKYATVELVESAIIRSCPGCRCRVTDVQATQRLSESCHRRQTDPAVYVGWRPQTQDHRL